MPEENVDGTPPPHPNSKTFKKRQKPRREKKARNPRGVIYRMTLDTSRLIRRTAKAMHLPKWYVEDVVRGKLRSAETEAVVDLAGDVAERQKMDAYIAEAEHENAIANALKPNSAEEPKP
jgi:hypothetical protein